ncbi:hypothetical protein [Hyphomonas beringensis]|uniref:hypothetical protein n=1 Tax=Hyphomonas beringensis TaxID=1280946 RepID=UPI000A50C423|nr:hypothetical protein [Hyphomonas beringensis]
MNATQAREVATANVDISAVVARARDFGFRLGTYEELKAGVALAEELMNSKLASVDAIARMNDHTGMTAWVTGDPVEGIFLTLPLTVAGEEAVRNGTYSPADPDLAHLAKQGRDVAAFYVGVYAGKTYEARKSIMTASAVMRVDQFGAFRSYARGATADGRRSMESLGFQRFEGGLPDLYVQQAFKPMPGEVA